MLIFTINFCSKQKFYFLLFIFYFSGLFSEKINQRFQAYKHLFENKSILILGGTGYIGRALIKEIIKFNPKEINILSRDEVKHFNLLKTKDSKVKNIIGDIRDYNCLLQYTKNIDLVIHAAALKRIDILEDNVEECIKTNVLGSLNVFNACVLNKVKKVIFISTDKSCSPINTYGGCKFISEKIFTNYSKRFTDTIFTVVRYGNVLESTGSILPIIYEKIKNNEDIPLTDNKMTRFIIDKDEAVELIFDAIKGGIGGEIFIKKLPSLKIIDLIEIMKEKFNANSNIKLIGIRPGEKLHEILINETEIYRTYDYEDKYIIVPTISDWLASLKLLPTYITNGKQFKLDKEYSSANCVIGKNEIEELFKKYNIIRTIYKSYNYKKNKTKNTLDIL